MSQRNGTQITLERAGHFNEHLKLLLGGHRQAGVLFSHLPNLYVFVWL